MLIRVTAASETGRAAGTSSPGISRAGSLPPSAFVHQAFTSSTRPSSTRQPAGVLRIEFMAALAMRCRSPAPVRSVRRPPGIFAGRTWLQVIGSDTGSDSAEMIERHSARNRSVRVFVHHSMDAKRAPVLITPHYSVAAIILGTTPQPTRAKVGPLCGDRTVSVNLFQDPIHQRSPMRGHRPYRRRKRSASGHRLK